MRRTLLLLLSFLAFSASAQNLNWAFHIDGHYGIGQNMQIGPLGNLYVVGNINGRADFDPGPDTAYNDANANGDLFIAKYDSLGNYIWHIAVGSSGTDIVRDIAVDNQGDVYIIGRTGGTMDIDPDTPVVWLRNVRSPDAFIAKFDSTGDYKWAHTLGGQGDDQGHGIDLDADGNVYVVGYNSMAVDFDPGVGTAILTPPNRNWDSYLASYDPQGNYRWVRPISGKGSDYIKSVYCDDKGKLYITGSFTDSLRFDTTKTVYHDALGNLDAITAAYDTAGNFIWSKQFGSASSALGEEIVGFKEHIYLSGVFYDSMYLDVPNNLNLLKTKQHAREHYLMKMDLMGNVIWTKSIIGNNHFEGASGIAVNENGLFATGQFYARSDFDYGSDSAFIDVQKANDLFLCAYDTSGNFKWAEGIFTNGSFDLSSGIVVKDKSVYITGVYSQFAKFDTLIPGGTLTSLGGRVFIAKYSDDCKPSRRDSLLSICSGDSVFVKGIYRKIALSVSDTLTGASCDSIINYIIRIADPLQSKRDTAICLGDSAFLGGQWQFVAGVYKDTVNAVTACDSIITTTLHIKTAQRCAHQPYVLRSDMKISKVLDIEARDAVRLMFDEANRKMYYLTFGGSIYSLDSVPNGLKSNLIFDKNDHGISHLQGGLFVGGNLYLLGNHKITGQEGTGLLMRGSPSVTPLTGAEYSRTAFAWDTVMYTDAYPSSAVLFDHAFSALTLNPAGDTLFISSGSRTDHGEVQDINGLYPNTREVALTSAIYKIPLNGQKILLRNDSTALQNSGYLYCRGVRNTFDMAFNELGHLIGVENSGDRDDPEEVNHLEQGKHYGFPWNMGGNTTPMQFPGFNPDNDSLISKKSLSYQRGGFVNDLSYPQKPSGLRLTPAIWNYGPDATYYRDSVTGIITNAIGGIPSLSPHRSPLGLLFDNSGELSGKYHKNSFCLSYSDGAGAFWRDKSIIPADSMEDLIMMNLVYGWGSGMYSMFSERIAAGFIHPVDAQQVDTSIYVLENGDEFGRSIWRVDFPACREAAIVSNINIDHCKAIVTFADQTPGTLNYSKWVFGDGDSTVAANAIHTYSSPGSYTVALEVQNCFGITRKSYQINISSLYSNISASGTLRAGDTTYFASSSGNVVRFHWDFGNGDTSNAVSPKYIYQNHGKYTVTLSVFDQYGCQKDSSVVVDILKGLGYDSYLSDFISVYPNPVKESLQIESTIQEVMTLELFDSSGKQLIKRKFTSMEVVNVSHLSSGVYLLRITDDQGRYLVKEILKNE